MAVRGWGRRDGAHRAVPLPPVDPGGARLARARTSFLADGAVDVDAVREPIRASWGRSRRREIPVDRLEVPFEAAVDADSVLLRAARPVLQEAAEQFSAEPVSLVLCDADGVVLTRDTGETALEERLDRVRLAPGFSYAERHVGTNGIGTALEGGAPARVFGHEHYVEHLEELACAAVPVHHPLTGRTLGVVNLTGWRRNAGVMMAATTAALARRVEASLLEQSHRHEHTLLRDYLLACRRSPDAVIAVGSDLLMLNDRARELLTPADQVPLLAEAVEALATGRRQQLLVDLPGGRTARLRCEPVDDGGVARGTGPGGTGQGGTGQGTAPGGVVTVQLIGRSPVVAAGVPTPTALPTAVGSGASWTRCRLAVERAFRSREWLVLEGEPGTGRTTLARAVHQSRTPGAHLRILDAAQGGPHFPVDVADDLTTGGGTLVLTHLDRLPPAELHALVDALEPHRGSSGGRWVVATLSPPGRDARGGGRDDLATLLALFPRTVEVPPLRHHVEDVVELVPHLLRRIRGADVTASPALLQVLMRNRWPGNVEQLHQVLRATAARRRTGTLEPADLPPECRPTTRRVLTPIEAIECDALVDALRDTDGNKSEAARRLGMSRATIYRKMRGYGLEPPDGG